ncbi:MAG: hypothetical protein R3C19_25355 [Planctomycetaceae bacterium]
MASQPNQPVAEFRMGLVKAVVWRNETSAGPRHNVTFARLYQQEGHWNETASFGRDDLPLVQRVAEQAHSFIFDQKPVPRGEQPATGN